MTCGVSIVIPSWNGLELLKRFLPSVIDAANRYTAQSQSPTEILVVDDGSVDESVAWLQGQGFVEVGEEQRGGGQKEKRREGDGEMGRGASTLNLRLIRNRSNRGFGETCNRGFGAASYPLVFLLNNDVEVDVNSIAPLVENFADDSVFAAHCRVFELNSPHECGTGKLGGFSRGFIRVHRSYVPRPVIDERASGHEPDIHRASLYSMFAGGGSSMFDRRKFLEIGGFSSLLSPFYWEDVEISYRAWKRGYTVLYEPRSVARHRLSSTIGKLDRRKIRKIEQRNRLIYHWIHLHDRSLMTSHIFWVALLAVTAPLRLKPSFISSCLAALKRLPEIRQRRLEERRAALRSDSSLFDIFAVLEKRAEVIAYDEYDELEKKSVVRS